MINVRIPHNTLISIVGGVLVGEFSSFISTATVALPVAKNIYSWAIKQSERAIIIYEMDWR